MQEQVIKTKTNYTSANDLQICLKVSDVAAVMSISPVTAYNLVKSEGFPRIKLGRRIVIPKDAFFNWLHNQTQTTL